MTSFTDSHYLDELKSIQGYRASVIMSFTGQIVVSDSIDPQINLDIIAAAFNDTFLVAHEATTEAGLEAATEIFFETPQQWLMIVCSGLDAKAHIHLLTILNKEGTIALVRMAMGKLLNKLMEDKVFLRKVSAIEKSAAQIIEQIKQDTISENSGSTAANQINQDLDLDRELLLNRAKQEQPLKIQDFFEVLVVYDSIVIRKKMEMELDKINIQPDLVDSSEKATRLLDKKRYDLVFSGINLSDGNGYQVCRIIKKNPKNKHAVVIFLSGSLSPYERVRSKLVGYDGHFSIHDLTSEKLANFIKLYLKKYQYSQ